MSKMRKEYDPNKVKRRKRKPIVYIICEGKETETLYFKHFRSRNCLVDIIPISSKHKAAEHLVKHAKALISQADYYPKDGDQLWCVFDCDDNKDSELQAAISYAEKHGYKIAYSNPAFEYWYLLHFEKRNGYLKDSATVIDILKSKGYLENYGKSVDVFEELQKHQPEAIQYAKERVERLTRDQVAVICRDSNPVTTVYELVEFLISQFRLFFCPSPAAGAHAATGRAFSIHKFHYKWSGHPQIKLRDRAKEENVWHFLTQQSVYCRLSLWLSVLVLASGEPSTCWRATAMITPVPMLMCGKVTHKNLIDNRPLFRYYSSIWIEKTSLIQYNKVSGRYLYEGKNTNH